MCQCQHARALAQPQRHILARAQKHKPTHLHYDPPSLAHNLALAACASASTHMHSHSRNATYSHAHKHEPTHQHYDLSSLVHVTLCLRHVCQGVTHAPHCHTHTHTHRREISLRVDMHHTHPPFHTHTHTHRREISLRVDMHHTATHTLIGVKYHSG